MLLCHKMRSLVAYKKPALLRYRIIPPTLVCKWYVACVIVAPKSEKIRVNNIMTAPIRSEPMVERAARIAEARPAGDGWVPATDADRDYARSQLAKMVAHPLFANSKRYPALLRHVVEFSLKGRADSLKERTLGIEVFGRKADYDTNLDPVVRITAGEIRKRIAQYYHEPEHEAELRIDLPAGSYVPQFHLPQPPRSTPLTVTGSPGAATVEQDSAPTAIGT